MAHSLRFRIGVAAALVVAAVAMGVASASEGPGSGPRAECGDLPDGRELAHACDAPSPDLPVGSGWGVDGSGGGAPGCPVAIDGLPGVGCEDIASWPVGFSYGQNGGPEGVTAMGQANLPGQGEDVRDDAIRQAVADARHQAEVAADAAGVSLGEVIDIEISASPVIVPVPGAERGGGASGKADPSPCPDGETCVYPEPFPIPLETYVTVTVTWALA